MMTETIVECRFDKACSSYLPNRTLEAAMYRALQHYGTPARTEEEREFARKIRATLTANDLQNSLKNIAATGPKREKRLPDAIRRRCWWMKLPHMPSPITCWQVPPMWGCQLEDACRTVL